MFHHNWVNTTGRVLDSRIRTMYNPRAGSGTISDSIALHSYIVEFRAPNGETTKLEVEQHIETVDVDVGSEVPLLVSPDGKKAVFDRKDPTINVTAVSKADKEADEERFRKQLEAAPSGAPGQDSVDHRLAKLQQLLDDGVLTPAEYFAQLQQTRDSR
jgi:hypothetical protein